ncbi:hypothetical protein MASR1M6_29420 [Rubrivivax sp.]
MPATFSCQALRAVRISTGMLRAGCTPAPQHGEAIEQRQPEVEHDEVEVLDLAEVVRFAPVGRGLDRVPGVGDRLHQLRAQRGVVLNDEDAHRPPSRVPCA